MGVCSINQMNEKSFSDIEVIEKKVTEMYIVGVTSSHSDNFSLYQ